MSAVAPAPRASERDPGKAQPALTVTGAPMANRANNSTTRLEKATMMALAAARPSRYQIMLRPAM